MQSRTPLFADVADLMSDAFSAAQAAGEEARAAFRARAERLIEEFALVSREEFESVRAEVEAAHAQIESLQARIAALEAETSKKPARAKPATKRSAAKKSSS